MSPPTLGEYLRMTAALAIAAAAPFVVALVSS